MSRAELARERFELRFAVGAIMAAAITGTGNFVVNLIRRIPKNKLEGVYKYRLFANEIMLLPYYIAALNIEHAYFEQTGKYEGFEGLCFVDTLDMAENKQGELGFMTAKNSVAPTSTGRRPILSAIVLKTSEPMSTPKFAALNTGPRAERSIFQSGTRAGAT